MFKSIFILLTGAVLLHTLVIDAQSLLGNENNAIEIQGNTTNDIKPIIEITKSGTNKDDWNIEIDYSTKIDFPKYTWLKPSEHIGSRLQLWSTNGIEFKIINSNVLEISNLPFQTTVLNVMKSVHPSSRRGLLWLQIRPGALFGMPSFNLKSNFNVSFTNDYVLQITPLVYKVETNEITAHLVKFPPIKVKLMANGHVQKLQ